jgi:hypothetical protein
LFHVRGVRRILAFLCPLLAGGDQPSMVSHLAADRSLPRPCLRSMTLPGALALVALKLSGLPSFCLFLMDAIVRGTTARADDQKNYD